MFPQNSAHWHLLLNHLPIVGTIAGLVLVFVLLFWDSEDFETVVFCWFVVTALTAIPVYLTGEPAEELVEGLSGVSHDLMEHHEEWALWAFVSLEVTGGFALLALLYRYFTGISGVWIRGILTGLVLITSGLMGYTAKLGGNIHHPETRPGFTAPEEHEDHEDTESARKDPAAEPNEEDSGTSQGTSRNEHDTNAGNGPGSIELDKKSSLMLRKEMVKLEGGMKQLLSHLIRGKKKKASRIAKTIHDSFILKQELTKQELKNLQDQLPDGFIQLDRGFHNDARKLAEAAKNGRIKDAMDRYTDMTGSCVTCHTRYARDRFPGLKPEAESKNRK